MHMADALVSPAVGGTMLAVSACAVAYSAAKIKKEDLTEKKLPIMGIMGAFVFAAQMINFTIPGTGSSGHIGGGILLAAVLGPCPALVAITAVLLIQCLFFADGGLLALGCNIFNIGVIPCLIGYPLVYKMFIKKGMNKKRITSASIVSVVVSLQLGSFCVVLQTLISGITALPFGTFAALMQPIHLAIGAVEGVVTALVLCFIHNVRPEILNDCNGDTHTVSTKKIIAVLAVLTITAGAVLSMFASSCPDGLEWSISSVTGQEEIRPGSDSAYRTAENIQNSTAFLPDYDYKTADGEGSATGTSVSGILGGAMVFVIAAVSGLIISKFKKAKE